MITFKCLYISTFTTHKFEILTPIAYIFILKPFPQTPILLRQLPEDCGGMKTVEV